MTSRILGLFIFALLPIAVPITTAAELKSQQALKVQFPVTKFKLENGLTVILHQDRSVPMISYHTWYRVGSRDERPGVTGAAHMLEHMMFKGAKKYGGKDFDRILHENGITNNAFTSWDYTGFYQNLPSSKLELMMDMEVDRMRFLNMKEEDLKSELEVVAEERRWRVDNSPPSLLREALFGTLFKVHPYRWPVIGTMEDIKAYKVQELKKFYDDFYVPNNAILVLAGDFDLAKTKAMVEKFYGPLVKKDLPPRKYSPEPEATKAQRFQIESEVQSRSLIIAYKGVESGHTDSFALDLAALVLGGGASSRLHKKLVYEDQASAGVSAYNLTNADPGSFLVSVAMKPGQRTERAEKIMKAEIEKIKKSPVSETELTKAKNQVMKDFVEELTTIDGKARSLAVNEILFGSYEKLFSDLEKYKAVTKEDIQRVANKYLLADKEVVGILNPKGKGNSL